MDHRHDDAFRAPVAEVDHSLDMLREYPTYGPGMSAFAVLRRAVAADRRSRPSWLTVTPDVRAGPGLPCSHVATRGAVAVNDRGGLATTDVGRLSDALTLVADDSNDRQQLSVAAQRLITPSHARVRRWYLDIYLRTTDAPAAAPSDTIRMMRPRGAGWTVARLPAWPIAGMHGRCPP